MILINKSGWGTVMQSQNYRCQPSSNRIYTILEVPTARLHFAAKLSKHWEVYLSYLELPKELKINSGVEKGKAIANLSLISSVLHLSLDLHGIFFTQVFLYVVNIPPIYALFIYCFHLRSLILTWFFFTSITGNYSF